MNVSRVALCGSDKVFVCSSDREKNRICVFTCYCHYVVLFALKSVE